MVAICIGRLCKWAPTPEAFSPASFGAICIGALCKWARSVRPGVVWGVGPSN